MGFEVFYGVCFRFLGGFRLFVFFCNVWLKLSKNLKICKVSTYNNDGQRKSSSDSNKQSKLFVKCGWFRYSILYVYMNMKSVKRLLGFLRRTPLNFEKRGCIYHTIIHWHFCVHIIMNKLHRYTCSLEQWHVRLSWMTNGSKATSRQTNKGSQQRLGDFRRAVLGSQSRGMWDLNGYMHPRPFQPWPITVYEVL